MKNSPSLSILLKDFIDLPDEFNVHCRELSLDTRTLTTGDVFFGIKGTQSDGHFFIEQAIKQGASAVVLDTTGSATVNTHTSTSRTVPIIHLPQLKDHLGEIAACFYGHPEHHLSLIGITGTSGKTSCSHYIAHALQASGHPCGVIGSLGYGLLPHLTPLEHTTPDVFTIYRLLAHLRKQGAKSVVMEVSSHALKQTRIQGLTFKVGIFTNLTQDHLDYHLTLDDYAASKRLLFENYQMEYALFNVDDALGKEWFNTLTGPLQKYPYTLNEPTLTHAISAQSISSTLEGIKAMLKTPWGEGVLHSSLLGQFNLYNLLATLGVLSIYAIPLADALHYLSDLHSVPGRMEKLGGHDQPLVIIDYSHKPDALEKALRTLKTYCKGELWCVFGCGGNRDALKRPLMGAIAERYANNLILTDDNPRDEDPKTIVQAILGGLAHPEQAVVEHDRRHAIHHAISCAQPEDIILIAGKGHEHYQEIARKKNPFNDNIEACLALENRIERL
ncbi:MAG: UDP-N-acetylmuramoyl-L-alanyl-D-glutamate--2,6-diaminopimelate ligase [Gammaproteobacteria bacterium]|nr:UDP-N-acetylmuramoyl-L-alanyl-D-glutamate--2,6-diaminopimelate ligase [Gammaproteobacteria bacterium]